MRVAHNRHLNQSWSLGLVATVLVLGPDDADLVPSSGKVVARVVQFWTEVFQDEFIARTLLGEAGIQHVSARVLARHSASPSDLPRAVSPQDRDASLLLSRFASASSCPEDEQELLLLVHLDGIPGVVPGLVPGIQGFKNPGSLGKTSDQAKSLKFILID